MARDNNGDFTLYPGTGNQDGNPVVTGDLITADWANGTMTDMATSMTDSLDRNGRGGMLQPLKGIDGANGGPAYSYTNHPQTGRYVDGSGRMVDTVTGTDILRLSTSGIEEYREGVWRVLSAPTATDVEYSNTTSGLSATNVQEAIDELKAADVTDYVDLVTDQSIDGVKSFTKEIKLAGSGMITGQSGDHLLSESSIGTSLFGDFANQAAVLAPTYDSFLHLIDGTGQNDAIVLNTKNAQSHLQAMINDAAHPIGSIFITSSTEHPDTTFPGQTWTAEAEGRVIVGVGTVDDGVNAPASVVDGETGGFLAHALTEAEMPAHVHKMRQDDDVQGASNNANRTKPYSSTGVEIDTSSAGSGAAHTNLQPFIARYTWRRTA